MKRWCLIQSGSKVHLRFLDPEKEGVLAFFNPNGTSYKIEGCKDILQSATEVKMERQTMKLMMFFQQNYPTLRVSA